jgi:hypothetical protein
MLDRVNEMVAAIQDQFAGRKETKKSVKALERQMKNLFEMVRSKGSLGSTGDDAMFSRKPLLGYACASCEKDLVNLQGKKVEYMPWHKMPFRDPSERIARVGQGFSKMLSVINPETMRSYDGERKPLTADSLVRTAPNFYVRDSQKQDKNLNYHHEASPNGSVIELDREEQSHVKNGIATERKLHTRVMMRRRN